ncbi:MerR family transcriptional regulator [Gehongia tenuis]|uniref:MerR family transcriptional regulator n=1 Tax=Gehongia tenuis TaxID=2763655 RepID=A0A926HQN2_9FIRM|nr:MerR family transcriptional regulator [Gehongia tenuis]MBC8532398.1 MerR family transcriptional regulator [Gehongia tenuis]
MKEYFSIGEAAKLVNTTSETLRHYDRIGLVNPSKKDEWTNYRYYTNQDIVRLNTVRALQQMDLPLREIKEVLEYDDLQKIVDYLAEAEKKADAKIAAIEYSKSKILLAKADYEKKLYGQSKNRDIFLREFPRRIIMLSSLEHPTVDNLWNYHRHFYGNIETSMHKQFEFEDAAGIYIENGKSQMFAICSRWVESDTLKVLPAGMYLCLDCNEESREIRLRELVQTVKSQYQINPGFSLQMIIISGVLKWKYQLQVPINPSS